MKKIIIITKKMTIGGCEKALISMLKVFPNNKYKVKLLVMSGGGELYKEIPNWVEIKCIPHMSSSSRDIVVSLIKSGKLAQAIKSLCYLSMMRFQNYYGQYLYHAKALPSIEEEFDLAIAYFAPCEFPDWYTVNNIKAKRKIAWVHSDVSKFKGINIQLNSNMYSKYDKIFCVSKDSRASFIKTFPGLSNKVELFYNIILKEDIASKGGCDTAYDDNFGGTRILTVGRLSREKGQDVIPPVLSRLIREGYNVRWYCIGGGVLKEELEHEIEKGHLSESLVLLGSKLNPYPYFAQCDIYVQPSRYEACCTTVNEAKCFNKPIIVTDFNGASEQIDHEQNGLIIKLNENELYSAVKRLIINKTLCYRFNTNLNRANIDTLSEINKLFHCIND